jgi:hypothetical protein
MVLEERINSKNRGMRTYHLKVEVATNTGFDRETGSEIKADEVERSANNEIRNLGYGLSTDKGKPMVGFGLEDISYFSPTSQSWVLELK